MKKYTIKYILSIIIVITLAFAFVGIWIILEGMGKPWTGVGIFLSCLAGFTHLIADVIYDESKDPSSVFKINNIVLGIIFIISMTTQIICTLIISIEAYKNFGVIHPIEYIIVAIFMLLSAYAFKKASYNLIGRLKKNEK